LLPTGWTLANWRQLPAVDRIEELIREKEEEYKKANTTATNAAAIKSKALLAILVLPEVPADLMEVLATSLEGTTAGAMEVVKAHLEKHKNIDLNWLERGFDVGEAKECPYCAQDTTGSELVQLYASIFNEALRSQQQRLNEIEAAVSSGFGEVSRLRLKQAFDTNGSEQQWWKDTGGLSISLSSDVNVDQVVDRMADVETTVRNVLKRKRNNPNQAITLSDTETQVLDAWRGCVDGAKPYLDSLSQANAAIRKHQSGIASSNTEQISRELDRFKATQARYAANAVAAFARLEQAEQKKGRADKEKTNANTALKEESIKMFKEYGGRINQNLTAFGVAFQIKQTGVSFTGGKPSGEIVIEMLNNEIKTSAADVGDPSRPSLLNTLSSGDKSTLALAYFLAVLDTQDKANSVVIFDDPFHRQDSARKGRTIDRIKDVVSDFGQTFVLSHDLDFACDVERIQVDGVRTFALFHKNNSDSTLKRQDFPALARKAHIKDYKTLEDFVTDPSNDDERCRSVVRAMRPALEGYYRVKYPSQFKSNDWLGDMIGKIREASSGSPLAASKSNVESLGQVNDYSKKHHHSDTDVEPIDHNELLNYAKQALCIIHG
ncbi:MAG TPA: AAA family ATPase, partial [Flavobacteriales bacterium]|nr:AAA family ATPase [Flavobacteriales bacterium]